MRQGLLRSAATLGFVLLWIPLVAGQTSAEERQKPGTLEFQESHKRILHLAPTFSIVPPDAEFKPLSAGDKFVLGATHAFDRITIVKSLASAAISQAADAPPGYGQGWDAYGVRVGAATASIGGNEFFSTFLFPVLLHQDPRYFALQTGRPKQRVWYAMSQILSTRTDSGGRAFNSAKILGTLFNAELVNAYYPAENRTVGGTFQRFGIRLAVGAGTNVLQEFVPEIRRLFSKKRQSGVPDSTMCRKGFC
jgi:hypothetical protein